MQAQSSQITAVLVAALVLFAVYRRFRRNFGRQPLRPKRMVFRIVLLSVIAALTAGTALGGLAYVAGIVLGCGAGVLLALWGASQTRFEREAAMWYYIPHTYTGVLVSVLFLGRLIYRLVQGFTPAADRGGPLAAYVQSPLTVGLFYLLVGYYVCYYSVLLVKSRALRGAAGAHAGSGSPLPGDT